MNARVARENETLRKDRGSKCEAMQRSLDREWWTCEKAETSYECWTIANLKNEYIIVFSYHLNRTLLALSDKDPKSMNYEEMMFEKRECWSVQNIVQRSERMAGTLTPKGFANSSPADNAEGVRQFQPSRQRRRRSPIPAQGWSGTRQPWDRKHE